MSLQEKLLDALWAMPEDDFTKNIIKPLFESMGYFRVDFNGGSYERGRDLIAQIRIPPKKTPSITYIQSKKTAKKQKVNDSTKISNLLHQLRQCQSEGVFGTEGEKLFPDTIYLASPAQMSNRFMEEINSQLFNNTIKIQPLDGVTIIELINEYDKSLLDIILPPKDKITEPETVSVINEDLFSALHLPLGKEIKDSYSDLSFFVGNIDSNLLFSLEISISY